MNNIAKLLLYAIFGFVPVLTQSGNKLYISSPPVTCKDIKFIVNFHNEARKLIANGSVIDQPKAADMQKIVWDTNLASIATNYSKLMNPGHNSKRNDSRFAVGLGENIFMTSSTNLKNTAMEWQRALNGWYGERMFYSYQVSFEGSPTGHYEQMIWADTIYIGCGATIFTSITSNKKMLQLNKLYVCNYAPRGNWYGTYPYDEQYVMTEQFESVALSVFDLLLSFGLLPSNTTRPNTTCDNLCCDFQQCAAPYGPLCK